MIELFVGFVCSLILYELIRYIQTHDYKGFYKESLTLGQCDQRSKMEEIHYTTIKVIIIVVIGIALVERYIL